MKRLHNAIRWLLLKALPLIKALYARFDIEISLLSLSKKEQIDFLLERMRVGRRGNIPGRRGNIPGAHIILLVLLVSVCAYAAPSPTKEAILRATRGMSLLPQNGSGGSQSFGPLTGNGAPPAVGCSNQYMYIDNAGGSLYICKGSTPTAITGGGGGVSSFNTLTGAVTISAGSNITLTPSGNNIAIASTAGGTGTLTASGLSLPVNQIMLGNTYPDTQPLGSLGTTTTVLHGNAGGAPSFGSVVSADLNITTSSCTNQFLTAISAAAAGTCTTDTLASAQHANQGTTTTVLHGNGAGNPSFSAVSLANDVTGQLPIGAVGSSGLSGTSPVTISAAGAIGCATCNTSNANVSSVSGDGVVITNSASTGAVTLTIAGTSGGVPCFSSTSAWKSSALLATNALAVGGGVGNCPATGNADFTYATHTLTSAAAGLIDFSAITSTTGFKVPSHATNTAGAAAVVDYDSTKGSTHAFTGAADSILAGFASAPAGSECLASSGTAGVVAETSGAACGTVTSIATTSPIGGGTITGSGTLTCSTCATTTNGGALSGTSPIAISAAGAISCTTCTTNASGLTSNLPMIGAGGQAAAVGTRTGNTTQFASWAGATTAARCVDTDASGNLEVTAADCSTGSAVNPAVSNVTAVTVSANTTNDQQAQELQLSAAYLNVATQPFLFHGSGIFSTTLTPSVTVKFKLCSVSGCGSGTVVTLATMVSATTMTGTNNQIIADMSCATHATGATGNLICHGILAIDLTASSVVTTTYSDANTAVSSNFDLTGSWFVDTSYAFSSGSASNSVTEQEMWLAPLATPTATSIACSGVTNGVCNNTTNTGTTAMTLDMSASTGATAFKVPVIAGATAGADGVIDYDPTNKNTHIRTNGADSIACGFASAPTTLDLVRVTVASSNVLCDDSGILAANVVTAASNGTTKQICTVASSNKACTWIDFPDVKEIPAANCNNTTAGAGWTVNSTFVAACGAALTTAHTNNLNGVLQGTPSVGTAVGYFDFELAGDWDTSVKPYIAIYYGSGENTSGTVIWTVSTACTKQDGSVSDDPSWIAESAMGTQTMATKNRMWAQSAQLAGAMTNCIAGSTMLVKMALSGTASASINVSKAVITQPRLLTVQAN